MYIWIINAGLKGKATITNYTIPDKVKRETKFQIYVEITELLLKGYVDLLVMGIKGQIHKDTYCMLAYKTKDGDDDENKDGKRERKIKWEVTIPKGAEIGDYKVVIIIYDVETEKWLAYKEKIIQIE